MVSMLLLLLQIKTKSKTKQGRKAKSTTTQEFEDIMVEVVKASKPLLQELGHQNVLYSWDNNKIQAAASLEKIGLRADERLHLPTYSPDMHKVIEHTFAQLKRIIVQKLAQLQPYQVTAAAAQRIVQEAFVELSTDSIRKDIESLPLAWSVISAATGVHIQGPGGRRFQGSAGGYPVAELR